MCYCIVLHIVLFYVQCNNELYADVALMYNNFVNFVNILITLSEVDSVPINSDNLESTVLLS